MTGVEDDSETRGHLTYGELRRRLESMGNPWSVDDAPGDDEPVPQFPTGGENLPPDLIRSATAVGQDIDVRRLIVSLPPSAPELRRRWAEEALPMDARVMPDIGDGLRADVPTESLVDEQNGEPQ